MKRIFAVFLFLFILSGVLQAQEVNPFDEGLKLFYQKRFADSKELFLEALQKDPLDTMALSFYLDASYRCHELMKAINYFEKKSMDEESSLVYKTYVGIAYFTRGLIDPSMMEEARSQLKDVLSEDPNLSIANSGMGMIYYQKRLIPRAKGYFIKALKNNPRDLMALERVGDILMIDDKNPQEALKYFNKIIEIAPNYSDGYFYAASAKEKLGDTEEAIRLFQKCMEIDPLGVLKGYDAPLRIGNIYLREKKWDKAEEYFKKALVINPKNPYAKTQLKKA